MYSFNLKAEQVFDPKKHMEKVLGRTGEGDVTIACWEPGQTSPVPLPSRRDRNLFLL